MTGEQPTQPLAGVRVLDLSRVFAGPVAGRILADLGADVVKVEPPEGDITRLWGTNVAGLSTYFLQQNCGKRNICIDLRIEGGPELVADLAAEADIVLENFRPGVLARYGLDYASLSARKPDLVMASISGFGQDGPESQRMAYASVAHAESGLVPAKRVKGAKDLPFSAADVISGLHGVIGLLAALRVKEQTGIGQHVDVAMIDAMTFSSDGSIASLDDRPRPLQGGMVWDTASGPVMVAGDLRWTWHQMSNTHDLVDPTPSDAELADKIASRKGIITDFLCGLPGRAEVVAALDDAGLAWGEIREMGEVLESPTFAHRETVAEVDDRAGGSRKVIRAPYRMSHSGRGDVGTGAFRGEHNAEVLAEWLGLDGGSVERLAAEEVLLADEWAAGDGPTEG